MSKIEEPSVDSRNLSQLEQNLLAAIETAKEAILTQTDLTLNEKAGLLGIATASCLGSCAGVMNLLSEQKRGRRFGMNEMVKAANSFILKRALEGTN
jgi:hypothetical protein